LIELTPEQLSPPDPNAEDKAFDVPNVHQTALRKLADYLEMDAVEKVPMAASMLARAAQAVRSVAQHVLERALQEPPDFKVSIAEPDKLALPRDVSAKDSVATFIMRAKRYAAVGLKDRLGDETLPAEQQQHSLQTLSLITGRNFHLEDPEQKVANATAWLNKQQKAIAPKPAAR
jgi:hypothetical protein